VARALEEQPKLDDLESLLEKMLAEPGDPLTDSEWKTADRASRFDRRSGGGD
jgi:hypothetical protein